MRLMTEIKRDVEGDFDSDRSDLRSIVGFSIIVILFGISLFTIWLFRIFLK